MFLFLMPQVIAESFITCRLAKDCKVNVKWISQRELILIRGINSLKFGSLVLVAPGVGARGLEGKDRCQSYVRENKNSNPRNLLGMQMAVLNCTRCIGFAPVPRIEPENEAPY